MTFSYDGLSMLSKSKRVTQPQNTVQKVFCKGKDLYQFYNIGNHFNRMYGHIVDGQFSRIRVSLYVYVFIIK